MEESGVIVHRHVLNPHLAEEEKESGGFFCHTVDAEGCPSNEEAASIAANPHCFHRSIKTGCTTPVP